MATFTADLLPCAVVVPGSAVMVENTYIGDASTTFAPGDLVRINTSGQIKDAATDSDTSGPVHGMILTNDFSSTAPAATEFVPILRFGADTILCMQIYAAAGADAQPQDLTVGVSYTLRNNSAGIWGVTTTTTKGIALVVQKPGNVKWFDSDYDPDKNFGLVYVRFTQAMIDARAS